MAIDPAFAETHSECYVAAGRRYTSSSNDSLVVFEGGALVLVHNSEVEQMVQNGLLLAPGQPYVAPAGFNMGMPLTPSSGISKRSTYGKAPSMASYPIASPSSATKQLTLPSEPTDAGSLSVQINSFTYLGPAIASVVGALVTLTILMLPDDVIVATYR